MPTLKQRNDNSTRRALIGTDRKYCVLHMGSDALVTQGARVHGFIDMLTRVDFQMHTLYCTHVCAHTHTLQHPRLHYQHDLSYPIILWDKLFAQMWHTIKNELAVHFPHYSVHYYSTLSGLSLWMVHRKPEEQYTNHNKQAASLDFCSAQHGHVDTDWFSI